MHDHRYLFGWAISLTKGPEWAGLTYEAQEGGDNTKNPGSWLNIWKASGVFQRAGNFMVPLIKNVGEDDITAGILRGTLSLDELNSFFCWELEHIQAIWSIFSWLVVSTPPKNMKVSWDDYSQYMEK